VGGGSPHRPAQWIAERDSATERTRYPARAGGGARPGQPKDRM